MDSIDVRIVRLRGFLAVDPSNADLACELADALFAQGAYSEGKIVLEDLRSQSGVSTGVRFRIARAALVLGDYVQAEATYRELIGAGQESAAVWHDLAFSQLCQRRANDAWESLQAAESRFGKETALSVLKARVAMMQGDFPLAIECTQDALSSDPQHASALGVHALALFDSGAFDAGHATTAQCLRQHPDQHEALLVAGTQALWHQDVRTSLAIFERALAQYPSSGRALSGYGQGLMLCNRLPEAQAALEHAVMVMPDHVGTWHALAWTQLLQGLRDAAERSYRQAYALDRNFGDTHGGLALIAALRGDMDSAEEGVKRALRLDPNAVTARYAQTLVLEARGDAGGAEVLMADLLQAQPSTAGTPVREFAARLKATLRAGTRQSA